MYPVGKKALQLAINVHHPVESQNGGLKVVGRVNVSDVPPNGALITVVKLSRPGSKAVSEVYWLTTVESD